MVNKLADVYVTTDTSAFVPDLSTGAVDNGAIFVLGHMSGAGLTAGNHTPGTDDWDATQTGLIYEWNSLGEAKADLGTMASGTSGSWSDGTITSGTAVAGYDGAFSLLRAVELVYKGNPTAKIYGAVLASSGSDAATLAAGAAQALSGSLAYKDISFVHGAGLEFDGTIQAHAIANERIYVGGVSLNDAYSTSTANTTDTFDVSAYTTLQEDTGRSVCFVGNVQHTFKTAWQGASSPEGIKEIGGNWFSAYLAGRLSRVSESTSLLAKGAGFQPTYNSLKRFWSSDELEVNYDARMMSIEYDNTSANIYAFEKAMTFSAVGNYFYLVTRRRIIDRVIQEVRTILKAQLGKPNIPTRRTGIERAVVRKLNDLLQAGLLTGEIGATVYVLTGDESNGVLRCDVSVKPVTEIEEAQLIIGVTV